MPDLSHGKPLDDAPGIIGISRAELPPLPDEVMSDPLAGRLDPRRWFADPSRPFEIEIGCGKGGFILSESRANPAVNYLGIEWAGEYYAYTADRLRRHAIPNVRMLHADATEFLRWRVPDGVARVIHLYFSDPWPKTRHHKNRVIQHAFLAEVWRVLTPGGELRIVTDHDELWAWCQEHFGAWAQTPAIGPHAGWPAAAPHPPFERLDFVSPTWVEEGEILGTNYERKMCLDRPPHGAVLRKRTR